MVVARIRALEEANLHGNVDVAVILPQVWKPAGRSAEGGPKEIAVTSSELEILTAIQREGGVAGVTTISVACGLTSGYVDYLCRYLKRGGYLSLVRRPGVYELTPKGEAALGKATFELDRYFEAQGQSLMAQALYRALHALASQLESEMGRPAAMPPLATRREIEGWAVGAEPLEARPEEIAIKSAFVDPLEGVDVEMEASFDRIGNLEETASDIGDAVTALRNLKAGTEDKEQEE